MPQATICILIAIFLYLSGMPAIGSCRSKWATFASDSFLGGLALVPFVTAMSAEDFSAASITDFIRSIISTAARAVLPISATIHAGGIGAAEV